MKKYTIASLVLLSFIIPSFVFAEPNCAVLNSIGLLADGCGGAQCVVGGNDPTCPNYVLNRVGRPTGWSDARLIAFSFRLAGNSGLRAIWIGTWNNPGTSALMAALLSGDLDLQSIGAALRASNPGTYKDYLNLTSVQKQSVVSALAAAGVSASSLKELGLGAGGLPDSYAWKQDRISAALSATFVQGVGSARVEASGNIVWNDNEGTEVMIGNAFNPAFVITNPYPRPVATHLFAAGTAVAGSSDPRTVEQNATLKTITMPNSSSVRPEYRGALLLPNGTISRDTSLLKIPPARASEIAAILAAGTDISKPSGGYLLILNRDGIPIQYMGVQPTAAVCTVLLTPGASLSVGMTREFLQAICSDVLPVDSPLLVRIAPPLPLDPGTTLSVKFIKGSMVKTTINRLNVRANAFIEATSLGRQSIGITGSIIDGPINASGYTWWKVNYTAGPDGWSVENYLEKNTALSSPPDLLTDADPNPDTESSPDCVVTINNNLRYRSRDPEVTILQRFLKEQKYLNAEPNGYFNSSTLTAVKNFQRNNGINPTGYVGIFTRKAINEISCS